VRDGARRKTPGVTILDVARRAGVSRSTVSRVLTEHPNVSRRARDAVEQAVQVTGFHPNGVARSLVSGRSTLVAIVVPSISHDFYADLARGVEKALADDFALVVMTTDDDPERERRALAHLQESRVAGVIVSTVHVDSLDHFGRDTPVVFVNRGPRQAKHSVVVSDNFRGGYLATNLLLQSGHERIGHVSLALDLPTSRRRHDGYLQALGEAGITPLPEWSFQAGLRIPDGISLGERLLAERTGVTALFTDSDTQAVGIIEALWRQGLRVPRDLSLVGYDDGPLAALSPFALTSVHTPRELMGELAGRLLKQGIQVGRPLEAQEIVLPVELITRASVGKPRRQRKLGSTTTSDDVE